MTADQDRLAKWRSRYPRVGDLERPASRRIPAFAFDFLQGGTGDELSRPRNMCGFSDIEIVPRYAVDVATIDTSVRLFDRDYATPVVIAPVGMDGGIWPNATRILARTARETNFAYMTGTLATASMEEVASTAPGQFWFQLYSMPAEDHRVSLDLVRRAQEAGAHVLAVTLDIPVRPRRVRDMRNAMRMPFHPGPRQMAQAVARPHWLAALARSGMPRFENLAAYSGPEPDTQAIEAFARDAMAGSGLTWDIVSRIRDAWRGPMLVKGIMHPADARKAQSLGVDGVIVSNHGGRQFDAAPAAIDVVPAVREAVGGEMRVLVDGGVVSGNDVLKALACGADAVMAGRAFMLGLAAIGEDGGALVAEILKDELRIALAQTGAIDVAGATRLAKRHRNAWTLEDFATAETSGQRGTIRSVG